MAEINLDFDGFERLKAQIKKLRENWEDKPVYAVGTNVEYAVFP